MLTERVIAAAMQEVRRRLRARAKVAGPELADAEKQAAKLKAEIGKLAEALLAADSTPAVVVRMISEREQQLATTQARIAASKMMPDAIDVETRRLEKQAKGKLTDLRRLLQGGTQEGRAALEALLDGPLIVTPVQDHNGERDVRRFQLTGRTVLGGFPMTVREQRPRRQDQCGADNRGRPQRGPSGSNHPCEPGHAATSWTLALTA